jgi:altronate hydrolase
MRTGGKQNQRDLIGQLIRMQYARNETDFSRGTFRVRGDTVDIFPAEHSELAIRVELFDDEIESLSLFDPLTGHLKQRLGRFTVFPSSHYVTPRATVMKGIDFVKEVLAESNTAKREAVPASELCVALQCGGSDGYSGITANPALGVASDLLVRHGGTVILSESPETYGAEHLLTRRATSREVGQKLVDVMHWWEDYTARQGAEMNANPSPGNKAGGLTTILEKSLGAMAKAGTTNLVEVYRYAEPVTAKGFVFMDTPGYDPVGATGQVAGGANLVCFTTGRGSVFGMKPAPSIKLATNTTMYDRLSEDMDINCGTVLTGGESVQACGERIFELMLRTASGEPTKSEALGFGAQEFAPWMLGATM